MSAKPIDWCRPLQTRKGEEVRYIGTLPSGKHVVQFRDGTILSVFDNGRQVLNMKQHDDVKQVQVEAHTAKDDWPLQDGR